MLRKKMFGNIVLFVLMFLFCGLGVFASDLNLGYNDNNGDTNGYLSLNYNQSDHGLNVSIINKEAINSLEINGFYKKVLNKDFNVMAQLNIIDNPRIDLGLLSTKLGLSSNYNLGVYTVISAGYGLDASKIRYENMLFSPYYDLRAKISLGSSTHTLATFANNKIRKHTAEAKFMLPGTKVPNLNINNANAGFKYVFTEYQSRQDYYFTVFFGLEV